MSKFGCEDPSGFFISAFIACPMDEVQKLSGKMAMMAVVDLGV